MIRLLISLTLILCTTIFAFGQMPQAVTTKGELGQANAVKTMACADQFAGTIEFQNFQGQSNDFDEATPIFLCIGDTYDVVHNGDMDLTGDPQVNSTPGITYAFYSGTPMISGPNQAAILTDPNLLFNPMPPMDGLPFFITGSTGSINGDLGLENTGALQINLNGGNPYQVWLAPLTVDVFIANPTSIGFEMDLNTGEGGPCVNANIDEAFSVVYLNELEASNSNIQSQCTSSFVIEGGLPEFDGSDYASITISLVTNPAVMGSVTSGAATHGSTVMIDVPQPGLYSVAIEDGKSCGTTLFVDFPTPNPLIVSASTETVPPGSPVCVDITAQNFNSILSMQWSMDYDETVLSNVSFQNLNANLGGIGTSLFDTGSEVTLSFVDPAISGITLPDNSVLFSLCFDVIGTGGDTGAISFTNNPTPIEIINGNGCDFMVDLTGIDGDVSVTLEAFGVDVDDQDISCFGAGDGSFTITATGGQAPFEVTWVGMNTGPGATTGTINTDGGTFTASNLLEDAYTVTVTDNLGNIVVVNAAVTEGPGIGAAIVQTIPTCFQDNDGALTVQVSLDGVIINPGADYTIEWVNTTIDPNVVISNDLTVPNLQGSNQLYTVTITSPEGCTAMASSTLSGPGAIEPNETIVNSTCSGINDGQIMLNITGGSGGYMTNWLTLNLNNVFNVNGLSDGIYPVEISDVNNCIDTFFLEVLPNKLLSLDETITGINCNGDMDGSILVVASTSGGISNNYTFNWIPTLMPTNTANTTTVSGLGAGLYQVFLEDDEGCNIDETYTITEPEVLVITELEVTNETCTVGMDGTATIEVTGGLYPYAYDWGVVGQVDSTATNLSAGTYIVSVTDANMCTGTLEVTIGAPMPPVVLDFADDMVSCSFSENGILNVNAIDGSGSIINYEWSTGAMGATENIIGNLSTGEYYVTITADDGCITIDTALVTAPDPLVLDNIDTEPTNCPGEGGGFANVFAVGGNMPYTYQWSNGFQGTGVIPLTGGDIVAGDYSVSIIDGNMCDTLIVPVTIEEPPMIMADFTNIMPVSCFDGQGVPCDGQATATAFYEGDPNNTQGQTWNFTWETPSTQADIGTFSSTATDLCQETQTVTVSDGQCSSQITVEIPFPAPVTATGVATPVSCFGDTDGSVTITEEGGTAPYMNQWSTGDVNVATVENLPPDQVVVVVTDANGCNFTFATEVGEPEPFVVFVDEASSFQELFCFGDEEGVLSVATNGGNPGVLTYDWENGVAGSNSSQAVGLAEGAYSVTVTDEKGCMDDIVAAITQPTQMTFEYSIGDIQCFGESTLFAIDTVIGGTADDYIEYGFRLNNQPSAISVTNTRNINAGEYVITVVDANECEVVDSFTLTQPNELIVDLPDVIEIELGDSMTQMSPIVLNDFPLDSIIWTPAGGLSNDTILNPIILNSIDDQLYTLEVIDVNGCMGSDNVLIEIDRNRNVYVPNVFSPNNNGYNDQFGVFGCVGVEQINSGRVFDRWGELVAEVTNLMPECESPNGTVIWDGMFRGKPVLDGVYVYMIEVQFLDGVVLTYRGDITVIH